MQSKWPNKTILQALHDNRVRWQQDQRQHSAAIPTAVSHLPQLPNQNIVLEIAHNLCALLFPAHLGASYFHISINNTPAQYEGEMQQLLEHTLNLLSTQIHLEFHTRQSHTKHSHSNTHKLAHAHLLVEQFATAIPQILTQLHMDAYAAYKGDPAAHHVDEVLLCYPGMRAIIYHRLAHALFGLGAPIIARMIAEIAHTETGIDIHPGAHIGTDFFIDHGTGVVIGETAIIGKRVRIYQAVTLGAKRFPKDGNGHLQKEWSRHPVVEDDVVIYAGATILGRVTIGHHSTIGGNVWLTHSVPPYSQITQTATVNQLPLS